MSTQGMSVAGDQTLLRGLNAGHVSPRGPRPSVSHTHPFVAPQRSSPCPPTQRPHLQMATQGMSAAGAGPNGQNVSPFMCSLCNKVFKDNAHLKRHVDGVHLKKRQHICSLCGLAYLQKDHLNDHMKMHTGVKAFACQVCGKRFAKKHNLQQHMNMHNGIKPYTCSLCDAAFAASSNLRTHKLKHHPNC